MKPETLNALKQSILKWEKNAAVKSWGDVKMAAGDCPLCQMFWNRNCAGCPVRDQTGYWRCEYTPYDEARYSWLVEDLPAFKRAAKSEVEFLKSLLPAEGKQQ